MNNNYDAIIIGAGIGGLTCGNLLAKNNMNVLIVEQHYKPGGYCTSYNREGCVFDVPTLITGIGKGSSIHTLLSYIGIHKKIELIKIDSIARIKSSDMSLNWYAHRKKFKQELIEKFPQEKNNIQSYFSESEKILNEILNSYYKPHFFQSLTYPFRFPRLFKYRNLTYSKFLDKFFLNQELKKVLESFWFWIGQPASKSPAIFYVAMLMTLGVDDETWAFYPKGGFQKFSDAFAQCFKENKGTIRLKTKVKKILMTKQTAIGVELENGEKIFANHIISNADTKRTFLELIGHQRLKNKVVNRIKNLEQSSSGIVVKLGLDMQLPDLLNNSRFFIYLPKQRDYADKLFQEVKKNEIKLDKDLIILETGISEDSKEISSLSIFHYPVHCKYNWLSDNKEDYKKLKEKIADELIKHAQRFIPDLSKHIIVKDICTPLTYERYTSATGGAWYDIAAIKEAMDNKFFGTTPINRLYLTGAKIMTGLPGSIRGGLITADIILKGKLTKGKRFLRKELLKVE